MSPEYLAGFIDGEGCLTVRKARRSHYTPVIVITNTNKLILELIQSLYGGTLHSKGKGAPKDKPGFMLVWSGSLRVLALLSVVEPFLILKKSQAVIVRALAEHLGKSTIKGRGHKIEDVVVAFRESLKQDIHTLNKRGIN